MKILVILISFLLPIAAISQIPNPGFESWSLINNIAEPHHWETNNGDTWSTSVSKTHDSYSGNFALQVIPNGPSFEGPGPGYAGTIFVNENPVDTISAYVKCDTISGTGKGIIRIIGFLGSNMQEIGYWETSVLIPQYTLIEIPLNPEGIYDSIYILIITSSIMDGTGWPTGFAKLKVDQLSDGTITGTKDLTSNKPLEIFPNPSHGELNLNYPEGMLSEVKVFDVNGRLVFQKSLFSSTVKFDVGHFPKGLYFIRTIDQNGLIETNKVIFD